MAKKSTVPENILHRVLQKSRKKIKEQIEPKTLLEVFSEELDDEENNDHGGKL